MTSSSEFTVDTVRELQENAIDRTWQDELLHVQTEIEDAANNGGNFVTLDFSKYVGRFLLLQELKSRGFSVASPFIERVTIGW